MSLPYPLSPAQTDAKSPVDDNLMDSMRLNLEYLDTIATQGGVPVYVWNVNGKLNYLSGRIAKRVDMQFLHVQQTFNRVRIAQEMSGNSGVTEIDIRYHSSPKTPIIGIDNQFSDSTTSIAQLGAAISTQAITAATAPVATQSISRAKASRSIQSIINVGASLWRYNLNTAPDSDYKVGDSVLIAGATTPANNGTFTIVEVNQSGGNNIVISNGAGAAQTLPAGTLDLQLWSYNLVNPANASYVAGETVVLAGHTDANNNGNKTIYAINQGGNNIWIKGATMVAQAGVAGTVACTRWVYTFGAPVPSRYVVGEKARFAAHSLGGNNGDFTVVAINNQTLTVSNVSGAAQGAAAGNASTLRWKYSFAGDPSINVSVGHSLVMAGHSSGGNNGIFTVVDLNDTTPNNIIVYNPNGVLQAGAAGTVISTRKLIKFAADQSLIYSAVAPSYVELKDCPDGVYNMNNYTLPYKVLEVNRGSGANYNIVIEVPTGSTQSSPAGFVAIEARSIFTMVDGSKPQVSSDMIGLTPHGILAATYSGASIISTPIPAQTYMGLYVLQVQGGSPENLSVMLT